MQWPIQEIEKLRTNAVRLPGKILKKGSVLEVPGVIAAQASHYNSEVGSCINFIEQNYGACLFFHLFILNFNRQMWRLHSMYQILAQEKC